MSSEDDLGRLGESKSGSFKSLLLGGIFYCFYSYGPSSNIFGWISFILSLFITNLYINQNQILYVPCPMGHSRRIRHNPPQYRSPNEYNIKFEDIMLKSSDGVQINAWLLLQEDINVSKSVPTIIYFHGNAGNIGTRLPYFKALFDRVCVNILAIDYRGYGESTVRKTKKHQLIMFIMCIFI